MCGYHTTWLIYIDVAIYSNISKKKSSWKICFF